MLAPNWGLSGSTNDQFTNLLVSFKLTPNQPLLPWQPIAVIKHKISYNLACIEDTSPIIAPTGGWGFGASSLTV